MNAFRDANTRIFSRANRTTSNPFGRYTTATHPKDLSSAQLTNAYRNWDLTKRRYTHEIKHGWLQDASDFVEEVSDGSRDLIPLDLRSMIHDARKLVGYPSYAWPAILHITGNGYGNLVFPVEWDVLGRPA